MSLADEGKPGGAAARGPEPFDPGRVLAALRRHERALPASESRYERLEKLGTGAMGSVYRARDRESGRLVAIKVLGAELQLHREGLARFRREAESLARLSHPHIVAFHELLDEPPSIVMELAPGQPLTSLLAGPRPERGVLLAIVEKVARALHHAHLQGVIHRDLKPANVVVSGSFEPKVADFGIAQLASEAGALTRTGAFLGTPVYMSPEQAAGDAKRVDARSDVYALGVLLYEVLTGTTPHEGSAMELIARIAATPPRPPRALDPTIAPALEAVALRALEKDPARRYPTAAAFADELERARHAPAPPAPGSRRLAALALGLGGVLALGLAARTVLSSSSTPGVLPGPSPAARPVESLEARLRRGKVQAGELEALAALPSGAELLERLAADAVVLPLDSLRAAAAHATSRARDSLGVLEAVSLLASEPLAPERALARARGLKTRGLARALLDALPAVARVRAAVERRSDVSLADEFSQGELPRAMLEGSLAPLASRPDLVGAAVAPLESAARTAVLGKALGGSHRLEALVGWTPTLASSLDRLPPSLATLDVDAAELWPQAAKLARALEPRDALLAAHVHVLAFVHLRPVNTPEEMASHDAAETLLALALARPDLPDDERAFARHQLYTLAHEATRAHLFRGLPAEGVARRASLDAALDAARLAVARAQYAIDPRAPGESTHRLAALLVERGELEAARRLKGFAPDDPLATLALPVTPRAVEALSPLLDQERIDISNYVRFSVRALRARARTLLGDAAGAAEDERVLDSLTTVDRWVEQVVAERLLPSDPAPAPR